MCKKALWALNQLGKILAQRFRAKRLASAQAVGMLEFGPERPLCWTRGRVSALDDRRECKSYPAMLDPAAGLRALTFYDEAKSMRCDHSAGTIRASNFRTPTASNNGQPQRAGSMAVVNRDLSGALIGVAMSFGANGATVEVNSRGAMEFFAASNNIVFSEVRSSTPLNFARAIPFEESDNIVIMSGHAESEALIALNSSSGFQSRRVSGAFTVKFQYSAEPDYRLRNSNDINWTGMVPRPHAEAVSEILRNQEGDPKCMLHALARVRSSFPSDLQIPTLGDAHITHVASYDFGAEAGCEENVTIDVGFCTTDSAPRRLCPTSETTPSTYGLVFLPRTDGPIIFNALSRRDLLSAVRN